MKGYISSKARGTAVSVLVELRKPSETFLWLQEAGRGHGAGEGKSHVSFRKVFS